MTVGQKIKSLRKTLGLTQTELGEKLGVKKNAVSKWECGRVDDIPMSKIKAMASLFSVSTAYLINDGDCEDAYKETAPTVPGERLEETPNYNVIKICGRDGSYSEKRLTDEELAAFAALFSRLPDASDDL